MERVLAFDKEPLPSRQPVILGMTTSDAHVVANTLLSYYLKENNFEVINLGACTSLAEFMETYRQYPHALAIVIGSLNGHAVEDLQDLSVAKQLNRVDCPVLVGGNLSVGSHKKKGIEEKLYNLGVDQVVNSPDDLLNILLILRLKRLHEKECTSHPRKEYVVNGLG